MEKEYSEDGRDLPGIWGVDAAAGLGMTGGNVGRYVQVLRQFGENEPEKSAGIERDAASGDWENFVIFVHALKSSAKVIGAAALSEEALALETAGRQGDYARCRQETPALLWRYRRIGGAIRGQYPKENVSAAAWDGDAVREILRGISEAAGDFDYFAAEEWESRLERYPFCGKAADVREALRRHMKEMDYFALQDAARELLALTEGQDGPRERAPGEAVP